jgi:cell division protein FtsW
MKVAFRSRLDWVLFLTTLGLISGGLVMVYSSSSLAAEWRFKEEHYYFLLRQGVAAAMAFVALTVLSQQDYRKFRSPMIAFAALGVVIFLLILVFAVDTKDHRWFRLGFFSIQPSEFAKPALIVFLAWFVTLRAPAINDKHTVRPAGLALAGLTGIVGVADLGTGMVLAATAAAIFFVAGLNRRYTAIAVAVALVFLTVAVFAKPFRLKRVIDFIDPEYKYLVYVDPGMKLKMRAEMGTSIRDTGYHALQSRIAVGAGGVAGLGLMQSKQKLLFLPEAHTDFIYAIIGEELGLWGATLVLLAFLVVLWRGYRLWWTAPDDFGRYIALGVTTALVFQALMNMSVVLDLGPTKGIPLPMISYGGSSLLSSGVCVGMLLSVSERAA